MSRLSAFTGPSMGRSHSCLPVSFGPPTQTSTQTLDAGRFAQSLTDSQPTLLMHFDRHLVLRYANRATLEWFGGERAAVLGRPIDELDGWQALHPGPSEIEDLLSGDAVRQECDITGLDGRRSHFLVHKVPTRDAGEVLGFHVIATDITALQEAESRLRRTNEELVVARDRAEAAMRAKSSFLANVSHEIRTPMNAILGLTNLLRRDVRDPGQAQRLDKVADAARHLLQVINEVLDVSKIEAGKLQLANADFSVATLFSSSCALVEDAARAKGLDLIADAGALPRTLHGDSTRLSQALVNLLSNAVKFTQRGHVTLQARVEEDGGDELLVRFTVRDTGDGIPAERLDSMFQPFEQAEGPHTRQLGGTGLGLVITRHLAERMGGEAGVSSELGRGSSFWFTARLRHAQASGAPAADMPLTGYRVLVVDDMADSRQPLAELLASRGLEVRTAASGMDALVLAAEADGTGRPFHLITLDWLMPHVDGLTTARRLQELGLKQPPVVVLISGLVDPRMRQQAVDLGIATVLERLDFIEMLDETLPGLLAGAEPCVVAHAQTAQQVAEDRLRQSHAGARVLLAEDNVINQEVAAELLRRAGLDVDIAPDGQAAVAMFGKRPYDLILMDLHMPQLNGLEATRLIRGREGGHRVPILAMTANAFDEDRAACLQAGMDEHIGKPVEPLLLYEALSRWLDERRPGRAPAARGAQVAPPPPRLAAAAATLDARLAAMVEGTGVEAAKGLEISGGNVEGYMALLGVFASLYAGGVAGLEPRLREATPQAAMAVRTELHGVGGAAATIGAEALRCECQRLQALLRSGEPLERLHADLLSFDAALRLTAQRLLRSTAAAS
ncbi:MAG: PAS domain-containing sensor histidine kinase [Aquabacterium sp.]|nr:MAG: PAS domain-containing sensor histidine kinase [Aquabacterium sp.]